MSAKIYTTSTPGRVIVLGMKFIKTMLKNNNIFAGR